MKTADIKFIQLCNEIDHWKARAQYWEDEYHLLVQENANLLNANMEATKQGVANALMFALNVKEGKDGELVIPKENREKLAKQYKIKEQIEE